jgi:hypothetical protein
VFNEGPIDIETNNDKAHIAMTKGGFAVGKVVVETSLGVKAGLYTVTSIGETVTVAEFDSFKTCDIVATVPFLKFIQGWKVYVGDIPRKIEGDYSNRWIADRKAVGVDIAKCKFYIALVDYARKYSSHTFGSVYLCCKPTVMRAAVQIEKNKIIMTPIVSLSAISTVASNNAISTGHMFKVGDAEYSFHIGRPSQPRKPSVSEWNADDTVNPLWWVTPTDQEKNANMVWKKVTHEGMSFPVMVNDKRICKDEVICFYKPVVAKKRFANADIGSGKKSIPAKKSRAA